MSDKRPLLQLYSHFKADLAGLGKSIASYKKLEDSLLFDRNFYAKRYPDAGNSNLDPIAHYVLFGTKDNRSPHPLFDPIFYGRTSGKPKTDGTVPLIHYVETGLKELSNPHQLFDAAFYKQQISADSIDCNPLEHYLCHGAAEGLSPFPLFDTKFYLDNNTDVAASGINPLIHFVLVGAFEGRSPHPLFDAEYYFQSLGLEPQKRCHLYQNQDQALLYMYENSPVLADSSGKSVNPLIHYLEHGLDEQRSPHALFSSKFYVEMNPCVKESGLNPLLHYMQVGEKNGYQPHPLFQPQYYEAQLPAHDLKSLLLTHFILHGGKLGYAASRFFDCSFYLEAYPDVAEAEVNPLIHFIKTGALEDRSPNPDFDQSLYQALYPEFHGAELGSAIEHYAVFGESEGRAMNLFQLLRKRGLTEAFVDMNVDKENLELRQDVENPEATIILYGSASEERLLGNLHSLSRQIKTRPFQIIAVNSSEGDNDDLFVSLGISVVKGTSEQLPMTLNKTAKLANGTFLVFMEKQLVLDIHCVRELLDTLIFNPNCGLVSPLIFSKTGPFFFNPAPMDNSIRLDLDMFPLHRADHTVVPAEAYQQSAFAISRDLFEHIGGFTIRPNANLREDSALSIDVSKYGFRVFVQRVALAMYQSNYWTQRKVVDNLHRAAKAIDHQ